MLNTANINSLWADVAIEELIRQGVDYFCISAGSRSTPLTAAVARRTESKDFGGHVVIHYDERGAAFHALGYGRATGKPAVLICTSGTAAANYYPAIVEASQENIPLIALTADRPSLLRLFGANQTIDQLHMYGEYVRWFHDFAVPGLKNDLHGVLGTIDEAVTRARSIPAGPVHLNCPFDEPLAPIGDSPDLQSAVKLLENWYNSGRPFNEPLYHPTLPPDEQLKLIARSLGTTKRGIVLAGRLDNPEQRAAVLSLCAKLKWPLLPDITSGLRLDSSERTINYYDLLLASEIFARSIRPDAVLHIGGRLVSKRLLEFLDRSRPGLYVLVNNSPARFDPARHFTDKLVCDIVSFCRGLEEEVWGSTSCTCLSLWQKANQTARQITSAATESTAEITEIAVARYITRHLPDGSGLFAASSMPVRDLDMFGDTNENDITIAANRGASGIDGTIASAAGFAAGLDRPVTLLIGDLAFLHDLNSLALLKAVQPPVTTVVFNNNGGGIFGHLPIVEVLDIFEKYFVTPHGLKFDKAAAMFDLPYTPVDDMPGFVSAFDLAQQSGRSSIIEVTLDRKRDVEFVNNVRAKIVAALENRK